MVVDGQINAEQVLACFKGQCLRACAGPFDKSSMDSRHEWHISAHYIMTLKSISVRGDGGSIS